ncbi:nicotinate-nucleotide adenylyltransferase [Anaerotaenia torta]|uniref:nicotinate-nucleotide adenylyltransferase n=1 Tax=Anaerotaenia torta TaxID=433293 RepID=UPI003D202FC3
MKMIGIMGGTFNPIHNGHLFLAENAYEQVGLEQVVFMPSKNPPHKAKLEGITDQQRVDMIALAIEDNPHFVLSTLELKRDGLTYTADTLELLTKEHPEEEYYFIVGADSLFMMDQWKEPQKIFDRCKVAAACRDGLDLKALADQAQYLKEKFHGEILLVEMPMMQLSSESIRGRAARGQSLRYYLPDRVIAYIEENQLYQTQR